MGAAKRSKNQRKLGRFVPLPYNMLESDAFRSLTSNSIRVFIEIKKRYNGKNNGRISLSVREAATLCSCGKTTAGKCFKELQEKGFIKKEFDGMFTYRKASEFILTCEDFENSYATNDWKKWECEKNHSTQGRTVKTKNR